MATVRTSPPHPVTTPTEGRHRWLILGIVAIAQLMVVLDATIVNIALPVAQSDLGFGDESRQWIVTAYSLAFGSLLLLGGRLSDLFGKKNTLIIGLAGFALASALGGAAGTFGLLVTARALQGVFGALLAPAALSILTTTFTDARERGRAFGIYGAVAGSGGAVGLLLGGVLTEFISWRWCLYVNLVFAAVALIGSVVYMPRGQKQARPRIDLPGVITITLGLVGIVYGFSNAETHGWADPVTLGTLIGGIILVALFVFIQARTTHPLLPLRVVLDRDRGGSLLAIGLSAIGMFGIFLFLTYYLQLTLGYSSLLTGVAFVPMPVAILLTSTFIGGRLLPKVGPKILLFIGGLLAGAGLLLLTGIGLDSAYLTGVLPGLIVMGLGMGLIFSAGMSTATAGVAREDAGVASASVNTVQQIGGSIGTALLSSVYASVVSSATGSSNHASQLATLDGYHVVFYISAAAMFAVAVLSGLIVRRNKDRITDPVGDNIPVGH